MHLELGLNELCYFFMFPTMMNRHIKLIRAAYTRLICSHFCEATSLRVAQLL